MPPEPLAVTSPAPGLRLHRITRAEAEELLAGRAPTHGPRWHPEYPTQDTLIALSLLRQAEQTGAVLPEDPPTWGLQQIVVDDVVVGDIGFHGPPADHESATVEIGYCVVPAMRRQGIAGEACRQLVAYAWRTGARQLVAEAALDNRASRSVLLRAGFVAVEPERFVARPAA